MPVGLDSFRNIANDFTTQDKQRIFTQNNGLQEKSAFGFFKFSARKSENDATINSFLNAIKADPTYKSYLSNATGLLKSNVPAGKPLTARVVRQVMASMNKQMQLCRTANHNAQALLEGTSFTKPFMGKFTQYCMQNHITLTPENREAVKLNLINFMKSSQAKAMISTICTRNGIPANNTNGFVNRLQRLNIVENTIHQIFAENPDEIPQNIDTKIEHALEEALEPALVLKALLPENSLDAFCGRFEVENAMNAAKTALAMYEQGIISADETFKAFDHLQMSGIDSANPMDTDEAKNLAITHFVLNNKMGNIVAHQLEEAGLPTSLAKPLSHYPNFFSAMQTKLADAHIDFMGGAYNEAELTAMVSETFSEFMADKADTLKAFLPLATAMNIAEKDMPKYINAFIGSASFVQTLTPSETGVVDKDAFLAAFREANQALLSSAHGFRGDFGKDDALKVMRTILGMHSASAEKAITLENVQYMQSEFKKFATELSYATSFLPANTPFAKRVAIQRETFQLHELLSQTNKAVAYSYLQAQGVSDADSDTYIIVDGQTIHDLANTFTEGIDAPSTHQKSAAFIRYAEDVGIPVQEDELGNAVAEHYFNASSDSAYAEPPARFVRIIEGLKEGVGMSTADLDGLKVDAKAINSKNFYARAQEAVRTYAKEHPDEVLTEAKITSLYEQSIRSQFIDIAEIIQHIHTSNTFPPEQKQRYIDMVLSTSITDAGTLDSIVQEMTSIDQRNLYNAEIALRNTQSFSDALPDAFTAVADSLVRIAHANKDALALMENPSELHRGVAMLLLSGTELSDAQKSTLSDTMYSQTMDHFAKAIMACRKFPYIRNRNIQTKLSTLHSFMSAFQSEVDTLSAKAKKQIPTQFTESITSKTTELEHSHIGILERFIGNQNVPVFTNIDKILASHHDRVSDEDWATLNTCFATLKKESSLSSYDSALLAGILVAKGEDLVEAQRAAGAPLTSAQIVYTISTDKAAGIKSPESLDSLKDTPQRLMAKQAALLYFPEIKETFSKGGALNTFNAASSIHLTVMVLGMTPSKLSNVIKTGALRLADIPSGLQLPSLNEYNAETGYGMYTDFQRMSSSSILTLQNKAGEGMAAAPQVHPDGAQKNPHIHKMIDFAASITQNETQQARVLQAFSQASTTYLRMCTTILAMNPIISENDAFDITATQQDDDAVIVQIRSKDNSPYNIVMDYHIPPDGSAQCTDFLLQVK